VERLNTKVTTKIENKDYSGGKKKKREKRSTQEIGGRHSKGISRPCVVRLEIEHKGGVWANNTELGCFETSKEKKNCNQRNEARKQRGGSCKKKKKKEGGGVRKKT